ncbi:MAG: beta-lactamase family protein [Ruminococcus sp.]|nr:beta-lactamase family protein [Ruminococcus sp.]
MLKPISILLCLLITGSALLCGCNSGEESETEPATQATTAPATVAPTTAAPATKDSADGQGYNYVAIKKKSGEIISQFDKIVEAKNFNGTIYMKLGNDFEYLSSKGAANSNKHIDNSVNTRFYIGGITKQFTAAAVLMLSEKKKLSLDDTLDKYFPDYEAGGKVTVKQLLNMTSGINTYVLHNDITTPSNYLIGDLDEKVKEDNSAKENKELILDWIFSQKLIFAPGTKFDESESNYFLLGEIIEQASGMSYDDYLKAAIFAPLGMGSSNFEPDEKTALAYDKAANTKSLNYKGVGYSAFGMISNVSDLLKWTDGLLNNQVLTPASFKLMFSNQVSGIKDNKISYGFGVKMNGKTAFINGKYDAFGSILSYNTDKSEIFVSLTNYTASDNKAVRDNFKKVLQKYSA